MVPPMALMSPMCSIMVLRAMGRMEMMAVRIRPPSAPPPNRENTVRSPWTGRPNQGAEATPLKSTLPVAAATA